MALITPIGRRNAVGGALSFAGAAALAGKARADNPAEAKIAMMVPLSGPHDGAVEGGLAAMHYLHRAETLRDEDPTSDARNQHPRPRTAVWWRGSTLEGRPSVRLNV